MKTEILIESELGQTRVALLEDGSLVEYYVERAGQEKVQIYAQYTDSRTPTPNFQLCGLAAADLDAGEEKTVTIDIPKYWVSAVLEDGTRCAPDGAVVLWIGGHQPDERSAALTGTACRKLVIR